MIHRDGRHVLGRGAAVSRAAGGALGRRWATAVLTAMAAGCAGATTPPAPPPAPGLPGASTRPVSPTTAGSDTAGLVLLPAGYGTLRQDDVAIRLQLPDVLVRLIPLDERIIRTLSPDSYRALRDLAESRRAQIVRASALRGQQRSRVWYASFFGLAPDARFSPLELTVSSNGRDFRPIDLIPLSTNFGEQRLQPRETQSALYLFDDAVESDQPLTVTLGASSSDSWAATLRVIERERALIRSRAGQRAPVP